MGAVKGVITISEEVFEQEDAGLLVQRDHLGHLGGGGGLLGAPACACTRRRRKGVVGCSGIFVWFPQTRSCRLPCTGSEVPEGPRGRSGRSRQGGRAHRRNKHRRKNKRGFDAAQGGGGSHFTTRSCHGSPGSRSASRVGFRMPTATWAMKQKRKHKSDFIYPARQILSGPQLKAQRNSSRQLPPQGSGCGSAIGSHVVDFFEKVSNMT